MDHSDLTGSESEYRCYGDTLDRSNMSEGGSYLPGIQEKGFKLETAGVHLYHRHTRDWS